MCRLPRSSSQEFDTSRAERQRLAFSCERLNGTTFVLEEHDRWSENPLIYVKVLPETLVLIDTGCGGAIQTPDIQGTLKEFLEDVSVETNGDRPLNPKATKSYAVICTHCHYDHIGGFKHDEICMPFADILLQGVLTNSMRRLGSPSGPVLWESQPSATPENCPQHRYAASSERRHLSIQ